MATFGAIEPFDGKNWELYHERLEHFFDANDLEVIEANNDGTNLPQVAARQSKRRAILLSVIGSSTYALLRNLISPRKPNAVAYNDIVTTLTNHYSPKPSVPVQRFKFQGRIRKQGESIAEYVSDLRSLAEHCDFGGDLNERLRDQLVSGVGDERVQKRMLMKDKLTFDDAYSIAVSNEIATRDATVFSNSDKAEHTTTNKIHSRYNKKKPQQNRQNSTSTNTQQSSFSTPETRKCFRCGDPSHLATTCPHKNRTCNYCHKVGHLSKICFRKNRPAGNTQPTSSVNAVETEDDEIFVISEGRDRPILRTLTVNNRQFTFQVDTGSGNSLINHTDYTKYFGSCKLTDSFVSLKSYTGDQIQVHGEFTANVENEGKKYNLPLIVVAGNGPALLGRKWLNELSSEVQNIRDTNYGEILQEHAELFDTSTIGCMKNFKAKLEVKADASPIFCKARLVPFSMRNKVEKEIEKLEGSGIIRKVTHAEWAAPIVPVLKPTGAIRLCGDYKLTVNQVAFIDKYPLPLVDEIFADIAGGEKFSKLDLSQAYHQLLLDDESRKYTTINTHMGLYEFLRLPYGVNTAVGLFQRAMETLLKGLKGVSTYLDDILVTGENDEQHRNNLRAVLRRLQDNGLRLKREKCEFFMDNVEYLGYRISSKGIHPTASKVRAIQEAPTPTNITELRSFAGIVNYYSRFQPNLAHTMSPIYKLLRKDEQWRWSSVEEEAFIKIKSMISTDITLAHYKPEKDLILSCDASPYGIGAVLQQPQENGILLPLFFVSRTLTAAEKNYPQIEREGLSIVFGVTKFRHYLLGRSWTLLTDHQPLVTLFNEKRSIPQLASARIKRWALTLSAYDYKVKHTAGKDNVCADYLSRAPLPETDDSDESEHATEVLLLQESDSYKPLSAKVVASETQKDPVLSRVAVMIREGWPTSTYDDDLAPFIRRRNELSTEQNVILWGHRVVVPTSLQPHLLLDLHEQHDGIVRMKAIARQYFWWPKIDSQIEDISATCERCQQTAPLPAKLPVASWNWPSAPWTRLHVDYAGPFMNAMFLIIVDAHSKWLEVFKTNGCTTEATIQCLSSLFARYGLPEHLVSDNGTCFTSAEFQEFLGRNNIRHTTTAPRHPATNGLAERYVGYFKQQMKKLSDSSLSIHEKINKFLFSYRTTPHPSTGSTPAKLLLGRELRTKFSSLRPSLNATMDIKVFENNSNVLPKFKAGDSVYALNLGRGHKWLPGVVIDVMNRSCSVQVEGFVWKRHEDQLRPRKAGTLTFPNITVGEEIQQETLITPTPVPVPVSSPVTTPPLLPQAPVETPSSEIKENQPQSTPVQPIKPISKIPQTPIQVRRNPQRERKIPLKYME